MNDKLAELGKQLHAKLDGGIDHLQATKDHLDDLYKETEAAIQAKLKVAQQTMETKKQEAAAAKAQVEALIASKKEETQAAVAEWKAKHDRQKLEKRAERAHNYAEARIAMALYSIEEAEVAILEAVAAQKDADGTL
jgi:CHASE3 domain sensor protein